MTSEAELAKKARWALSAMDAARPAAVSVDRSKGHERLKWCRIQGRLIAVPVVLKRR
jgi:hypothetical protein